MEKKKMMTEDDFTIKLEKGECFKPLDQRLVVKLFDVSPQTSGGIYIPDTALDKERKKQIIASVVSVGGSVGVDWVKISETESIKPGVKVLVGRFAGMELKPKWIREEDGEYRLINDKDIAGVFLKE